MSFFVTSCTHDISRLVKPVSDSVIIGLESAAYFLNLADSYTKINNARVFASLPVKSDGLSVIHLDKPAPGDKEIIRFNGCWCTAPMQTIRDLLTPAYEASPLVTVEVLTPYYLDCNDELDYFHHLLNEEQWAELQKILPAVRDSVSS